jgi:hypothetical protein
MQEGKITVRRGAVVKVDGVDAWTLTEGESPSEVLKKLKAAGWQPEGAVPRYQTTGEYVIPIQKAG